MQRGNRSLFVRVRPEISIAEVERHTYFQLPVTYRTESDYPKLCYSYVEWTEAGIELRTFRIQGKRSELRLFCCNYAYVINNKTALWL